MSYQITDDTETPRITPAVQWLIAINVAIYFLQLTVVRPEDVQQTLGFEVREEELLREEELRGGGRRSRSCSCTAGSGISP